MADSRSDVYAEEYYKIALGQGLYTSELSTNIPDGYSVSCYNMIATGDSLENRPGLKKPSVDWVSWSYVAAAPSPASSIDAFYEIAPWGGDSSKPAFIWSSSGYDAQTSGTAIGATLNLIRAEGTHDANNGFASVSIPTASRGICQYDGTIYFLLATGVQKVTAINWATDSVTYSAVASGTISSMEGLISFKDRLWAFLGNKLYYTNIPTVGGLPETWAAATNFVPVVGPGGASKILKVVPVGNKLCIFTTNGLFTLLVEGEPASWIFRILDSKAICTSHQCAFESKGIIYYVTTEGVWGTNGLKCSDLSKMISDSFFLSTGTRMHTITHYEDGMIVSVIKLTASGDVANVDNAFSNVFYSKLDPICWTNWDVGNVDKPDTDFSLVGIVSTTNKIPTYLNPDPVIYAMGITSNSTLAAPKLAAIQLLVFDGAHDEYRIALSTVSSFIELYLQTKHFDGGNQYAFKMAKRGILELFTSDSEHDITTSWSLDATTSVATEVRPTITQDFTVGLGSNLIQIRADFHYRRASFHLRCQLQTDQSQIKIKDLAVAQQLERAEYERVR